MASTHISQREARQLRKRVEELERTMTITVKRLESGYVLIRGNGPCEWAQPPYWPCSEDVLRTHAFPEASENFIRAVLQEAMCGG